jgi:hypothetical protein
MALKAVKITNPNWLPIIAPNINVFVDKIKVSGIQYGPLYTYFANTVQNAAKVRITTDEMGIKWEDMSEFWVIFEEDDPVGMAHWLVRSIPYVGTVLCDFVYSWNKNPEVFQVLVDEFEKFGIRHRCNIYELFAVNDAVVRLYGKAATKRGYEMVITPFKQLVFRKGV